MKKFALLLAFLMFAVPVFADIAVEPKPSPSPKKKEIASSMRIESLADITEARLLVPKSMTRQLRAAMDEEGMDNPTFAGLSSTQTVVAGLLLSCAFVFGGVWFVRSAKESNKATRAAMIFALLFAGGAVVSVSFANMRPPEMQTLNSDILSERASRFGVRGAIKIEVSSNVSQFVLQVPLVPDADPKR